MLFRYIISMTVLGFATGIQAQEKNPTAVPDPEYMNQVYYIGDSTKLVSIEKEKATMKTKTKLGGLGGASSAYIMEGSSSAVKLTGSQPSFAVKMDVHLMMDLQGMLKLYRFDRKNNSREHMITKSGFVGKNSLYNTEGISYTIKKTATGVYILSPEEPLTPGEYAFMNMMQMGGSGMNMTYSAYAFSIN